MKLPRDDISNLTVKLIKSLDKQIDYGELMPSDAIKLLALLAKIDPDQLVDEDEDCIDSKDLTHVRRVFNLEVEG